MLPNAEMPSFPVTFVIDEPVTDKRCGRCDELPPGVVDPPSLLCGIREGVASSESEMRVCEYFCDQTLLLFHKCGIKFNLLNFENKKRNFIPVLSSESVEPCRDGGFDPGREPGFEPPGVKPLLGVYDGLRGVYRPPKLLSLSLNESGVDADNDDLDGRDIATERADRSRI